jgi:hypothetical protein
MTAVGEAQDAVGWVGLSGIGWVAEKPAECAMWRTV